MDSLPSKSLDSTRGRLLPGLDRKSGTKPQTLTGTVLIGEAGNGLPRQMLDQLACVASFGRGKGVKLTISLGELFFAKKHCRLLSGTSLSQQGRPLPRS